MDPVDYDKIGYQYAILLGLKGEDDPIVEQLVEQYADNEEMARRFIAINLLYRMLKEQYG